MLADLAAVVAAFASAVLGIALVSSAVTAAIIWLIRIQPRTYRRHLRKYLSRVRVDHYNRIGLNPSRSRLQRQLQRETTALLSKTLGATPLGSEGALPRWYPTDLSLGEPRALLDDLFADISTEERDRVDKELSMLTAPLFDRFRVLAGVLTFVISAVLAALLQISLLEFIAALTTGDLIWVTGVMPIGWAFYVSDSIHWSSVLGVILTGFFSATASQPLLSTTYARFDSRFAPPKYRPLVRKKSPDSGELAPTIGRPGNLVRALNFAGGAFDSMMQIGATHALLVIQGRAPDAVVGLSSGAMHAAALAEVLQAGEEIERQFLSEKAQGLGLPPDTDGSTIFAGMLPEDRIALQRRRLLARVARLRTFIDATQRAPEQLMDALLPDAYQIDSSDPLHPLEQPRFSPAERDQQSAAVSGRSGLVRLYNDVLGIPFTIGAITRIVRRVLGVIASAEIRKRPVRWLVRISESVRLWMLVGANLHFMPPLVRIAAKTVLGMRSGRMASAGALIFKFPTVRFVVISFWNSLAFLYLLVIWTTVSIVLLIPGLLITLPSGLPTVLCIPLSIAIYGAIAVIAARAVQGSSEIERLAFETAFTDVAKGVAVLGTATLVWGSIFGALLLIPELFAWGTIAASKVELTTILKRGLAVFAVLAGVTIAVVLRSRRGGRSFIDRLLASYGLGESLLREHGLRSFLVKLFDENYYQKPNLDEVVRASLADQKRRYPTDDAPAPSAKRISAYASKERLQPVHVGIGVADASTGKLDVVPASTTVIDGLLAAVAVTPFFPAVHLGEKLYIDGTNVTKEPTRALLKLLRNRLHPDAKTVHIYGVSAFPVTRNSLPLSQARHAQNDAAPADPASGSILLNLVDVARRALRLQRFRDATVDRRLTELFTRMIPVGEPQMRVSWKGVDGKPDTETYYRAWVTPIELDSDDSLARRILWAPKEKRRQAIAEAMADGCRATMEVLISRAIENAAKNNPQPHNDVLQKARIGSVVTCRKAVESHMANMVANGLPAELGILKMPGSGESGGPGLPEICSRCKLWRNAPPQAVQANGSEAENKFPTQKEIEAAAEGRNAHLLLRANYLKRSESGPAYAPTWPHERLVVPDDPPGDPHFELEDNGEKSVISKALGALKTQQEQPTRRGEPTWPRKRGDVEGGARPTVSVLFSGGVFRGVYQMGVLNALNMLSLKPDLIAGASVGAITAAMVAKTLALENRIEPKGKVTRRKDLRVTKLAAIYLAVDRLILTDRFADFVREFTIRAADARFSIRQADRVFRKYDYPSLWEFDRNVRDVLAGLERLLYISPYQLNDFVGAFRAHDRKRVLLILREFAQQVLDRYQVGDEALGSEPLRDLIGEYVVGNSGGNGVGAVTFDDLRDATAGIQFLATTTNLTEGRLEVLGECPIAAEERPYRAPSLMEGLLASSAFPGVFRPRWSWELYPASEVEHQYIDGGVIDNLPIDAVAQFLHRAAGNKLIQSSPGHPHLAIAVSLEANTPAFNLPSTREEYKRSWVALWKRSRELNYNEKLSSYGSAEAKLRRIIERHKTGESFDALELEVLPIKPEWLPSTFSFHPMLGFRRKKQCQSIAHGCASTLLQLKHAEASQAAHMPAWGINTALLPTATTWTDAFKGMDDRTRLKRFLDRVAGLPVVSRNVLRLKRILRLKQPAGADRAPTIPETATGKCWLVDRQCPFSQQALVDLNVQVQAADGKGEHGPLPQDTLNQLRGIHVACWKRATHLKPI